MRLQYWNRISIKSVGLGNPNAISILQQNLDKIDWAEFSTNPSIFEDEDYDCK